MEREQFTQLRVLLERQVVSLEQATKDISEIKLRIPHEGEQRIKDLESDVSSLNRWKYGLAMVGTTLIGLFEFVIRRS